MTHRLVVAFLLAALVAGAAAGIDALSAESPSSQRSTNTSQLFEIFGTAAETPRTEADRVSLRNVRLVDSKGVPTNRQLVSQREGLWAVATGHLLCIAQARGAACASQREAYEKGVLLGTFKPPNHRQSKPHDFQLQGLVPDDVEQVLLVVGVRKHLVIDVTHNLFSVERDKPVHLIRLVRR